MKTYQIFIILVIVITSVISSLADDQSDNQSIAVPEFGPDTGALQVGSSPPGAAVYLYDDFEGKTPENGYIVKSNLNPGEYPLRLNLSGYVDYAIDVKIPRNRVVTVDAVLWPVSEDKTTSTSGNLTIQSNPTKADFFIDEDYRGITPLTLKDVSTGYHSLEIRKDGYSDYTETITVVSNQTTVITANLTII